MGVNMSRITTTIKSNSRSLRTNMTDAEQHLWRHLRMRQMHGLKFRRQHPCENYILDFACLEIKLAIELDGGQHNLQHIKDNARTKVLANQGWTLLRFWNDEALKNTEGVLMSVDAACRKLLPPSQPSP